MTVDYEFRFTTLPVLQPDVMTWRSRLGYRKRWHKLVADQVIAFRPILPKEPITRARVVCVRHSSREPDSDNLAYSFKPVLDGFVRAGVLKDDDPSVTRPDVRWEKAPPKGGRITVTITPGSEPSA